MLVYLADLRYTTVAISPDNMPLGIGFLAAYAKKVLGDDVQFKLFGFPEHLMEELRRTKPDVLGVTNYCWSYTLHSRMLEYARGLYPDLLTVMGGPNIALDEAGRERRLTQTSGLDLYVIDEGEEAFATLLSRYQDAGLDKKRLFQQPIPSSIFTDSTSGQVVSGTPAIRRRELDDIPSPYLTGLMDSFFDNSLTPLIQTSRGCPFTCSFCVEGVNYMTKVNRFSVDRVREELEYIAVRAKAGSALMISDSNFGMLPGDLDIAQAIRETQKGTNWPRYIWATTGKNNKEAILAAMDVLDGTLVMSNSVQSMDQKVLANIKRSNIKLETYAALQQEIQDRNLQSAAEVIVALPGETLDSFLRGICQLLDSGAQQIQCYQLMLLDGTELNNQATREQHGIKTKFRVLPRSFGDYAGSPVFEVEEIVVETDTMSFEDFLECRKLQLILDVYHREGIFEEFLGYLKNNQIAPSVFIIDLLAHLDQAPEDVKTLFTDYLFEAKGELFDSPEEARSVLTTHYQRVLENEIGGNLVFKYSAIAWFRNLDAILRYGMDRAKALVFEGRGEDTDTANQMARELECVRQYILARTINIFDIEEQVKDVVVSLEYDIASWKKDGFQVDLSQYKFPPITGNPAVNGPGREHVFYVPKAHATYLKEKLGMHGTSTQAVSLLLTRVVLRDLQRQVKELVVGGHT